MFGWEINTKHRVFCNYNNKCRVWIQSLKLKMLLTKKTPTIFCK